MGRIVEVDAATGEIHVKRGYKVVEVEEEDDCCLGSCFDTGSSVTVENSYGRSVARAPAKTYEEKDEFSKAIHDFQAYLKAASAQNSKFMDRATRHVENMLLHDKELSE